MVALVELAGAVAHELNNIFTAVAGNLSLIDEDLPQDGGDSSARIGEVIRTAQRGIVLSSKLLDGVHLRISLAREECPSFVDEDKLRASVEEILGNAVAAMPRGGQIIVETRHHTAGAEPVKNMPLLRPGRYVLIAVSDTGKGMEPHVAARAVDPLFTTKTPGINVGWGLSNCAGFVRQSGGYMTLASKLGLGTRVEIYLPLQQG
jgi:signal transduction histidine kinase